MVKSESIVLDAPVSSGKVLQWRNNSSNSPSIVIENLDSAEDTTVAVKESSNGTTWTDVSGLGSVTVSAGAATVLNPTSSAVYLSVYANNEVKVHITVTRRYTNGSSLD